MEDTNKMIRRKIKQFDIKKGVALRGVYPDKGKLINQYAIASYMLPDGIHKHDSDISVFTSQIQYSEEMDENKSSEKFFFYNIIKNKKDDNL